MHRTYSLIAIILALTITLQSFASYFTRGKVVASPNNFTPATISNVHADGGTASSSFVKFTQGTTTGQLDGDGFDVGIATESNAYFNQWENAAINFATNGLDALSISATQSLVVKNRIELEDPDSGTNRISVMASESIASDYTLRLPATLGTVGQYLQLGGKLGATADLVFSTVSSTGAAVDSFSEITNLSLTTSVAASALTIALKGNDGNDPSGSNVVKIAFRNSTAGTGTYVQRSVTAATSVVVPSGATLGSVSGVEFWINVYAIDNAGTVELAVTGGRLFDEGELQTSSTIGTGSDFQSFLYSTTGRTSKPIRYLGRIRITEATAGTYASNATSISLLPQGVKSRVRLADACAGGTGRVTGSAPTAIGEYRSYLRNAGAGTGTETNGSPTATPSVADGFKLYSSNGWASTDTNNNPSIYEIFVGKNKTNVMFEFYSSTGRTGYIDVNTHEISTTYVYGTSAMYDPTTGIVKVKQFITGNGSTDHLVGLSDPVSDAQSLYFDIIAEESL